MITDFVFCTIPLWLRRLGNTAAKSWCFGLLQRIYQFFRRLCYESWIGKTLSRHEQEGHIYKNSLTCRVLDALLRGIVQFVRTIVSLLTFGTYDSVAISLGKRVCAHWTFLDFSFLCGGSIFLMLICPGEYWRNIFGLGISFLLAMALLVITAVKQRETLTVKKLGLPFVIFVFATIVGVGVANDRSEALRVFCFFLTAFLLCIVLIGSLTDEKALKKFLSFIYWAMIVMALMGFYQRIAGVEVSASLTDLTVNAGMPGRVYSSFENPNNYAEAIVLLLPLALAYCTMVEGQNHRIAALLSLLSAGGRAANDIFPLRMGEFCFGRSCVCFLLQQTSDAGISAASVAGNSTTSSNDHQPDFDHWLHQGFFQYLSSLYLGQRTKHDSGLWSTRPWPGTGKFPAGISGLCA